MTYRRFIAILFVMSANLMANDLLDGIMLMMGNHPRIQAISKSHEASVERIKETHRKQFGLQLDFSMAEGYQRYKKPLLEFTEKEAKENTLKITKMLYDFGKSEALEEDARFTSNQVEISVASVKQALILEAITAYLSYQRALEILKFAKNSEENIRQQTKLEDMMVQTGKGYSSNVLQAKTSLAGAQSRRVQAEGSVLVAKARIKAVFRQHAEVLNYETEVKVTDLLLPSSLEDAEKIAVEQNRQIQIGMERSKAFNERIKSTFAREFRPKIQFSGEVSRNFDRDGNDGLQENAKAFFEVVFPFNANGAGFSALSAAELELEASVKREAEIKDQVKEQVAISWQNLQTAKTNKVYLRNQVNIATEYLEIARKERQAGKRTLLDVLSAETSLNNAQSDFASTEFDFNIAAFTLLQAMGVLELDSITKSAI